MDSNFPIPNIPESPKSKHKLNLWMILTGILAVALVANMFGPGITGMVVSEEEISQNVIKLIAANIQGSSPQISEIVKENGLYRVTAQVQGRPMLFYVTLDGKMLFPQIIMLDGTQPETPEGVESQQPPEVNVPKSDKPNVEVFVMSHCPYGTQIEKGVIPVAELLGDKIDFNIRFVYYVMHGEEEAYEQTQQYCIQKEQNDKFFDYMRCFLKDGNGGPCLVETKIDVSKLNSCVAKTKEQFKIDENLEDQSKWLSGRFPLFNVDKELNDKYEIGGSPGFVINGEQVNSGRDSASLLSAVCNAFNEAPAECSEEISSAQPTPGFGWETTAGGAATAATCG